MTDVAKRASVSVSTVSRVLNKSKYVEPDVEARVRTAISELNYQTNQHARWLSSRRSNVIGLIMPAVDDSNEAAFLHACSTSLKIDGFELMVGLSSGDKHSEAALIQAQVQSHVSGIVFVSSSSDQKIRVLLRNSGVPILYAWNTGAGRSPHSVGFDDARAAAVLVRRVLAVGYRRIHIICGRGSDPMVKRRVASCVATLEESSIRGVQIIETDGTAEGGQLAAQRLLEEDLPELLLCFSDYLAIGALRAAFERGLTVPSDIAVTGFGENIYSNTCSPSLTTVRLESKELGELAGRTMIRLIKGMEVPRVSIVNFTIVSGDSCPLDPESE